MAGGGNTFVLLKIWTVMPVNFPGKRVHSCSIATRARSPFLMWVMDAFRWVVQVVLRPEQTKGFVLLKKRWVVERT